jgi:hypothetical protein
MQVTLTDKYFEMPQEDTTIYHYTNADSLISILSSMALHASNVLFMNDPLELSFAMGMAETVVDETTHHNKQPINDIYRKYYKTYFMTKLEPRAARQFVLSFSLKGDSLHMWNSYANNEGYALGFRLKDFAEGLLFLDANDTSTKSLLLMQDGKFDFTDYSVYFGKMLYSQDKQRKMIEDAVKFVDTALGLISVYRPGRPAEEMQGEMSRFLQLFVAMLYNIKHEPHEVENEFRVVLLPDPGFRGTQYAPRRGIVTPYVVLGPIEKVIARIVIGPKMREQMAETGLLSLA